MADHTRAAHGALRRKRMDRALEAVIGVGLAVFDNLEGFVVIIAAGFASRHGIVLKVLACETKPARSILGSGTVTTSGEVAPSSMATFVAGGISGTNRPL